MKNNIKEFKNKLSTSFINFLGTKVGRKIVVIESDDWGMIRMSSKEAFKSLQNKGFKVNQCPYNTNDALESNEDLNLLFDVLTSIRGSDDNPAIITANMIVGNPDFEKIKGCDFEDYFFEPFYETLKRYPNHDQVKDIYLKGINEGVVMPQFHGREHVHVQHWMDALQKGCRNAKDPFEHQMFSVFLGEKSTCNKEFLNAMASYGKDDFSIIKESVAQGLDLFENIWGFKSKSVIAPCYNWGTSLEKTFAEKDIKIIQGGRAQLIPVQDENFNSVKRHYNGQRNLYNQFYTVRNVTFEPAIIPNKNWIDSGMREVENAFFWNKPAIISSHRLNYIGWLNEKNRAQNLRLLSVFLKKIVKKWPDVIFIS